MFGVIDTYVYRDLPPAAGGEALGLEDVPAVGLQHPAVLLLDVVPHLLQEVGEQVLLISEV